MASRLCNSKRLSIGLFLTFFVLLGFTSSPASAAPAKSSVIIDRVESRLFGYVRSSAPKACSANRQVTVFKFREGKSALVAGRTRATRYGKAWQWSLRKDRPSGKYRARLMAKPGCGGAQSRPIVLNKSSGQYPWCPSGGPCWIGLPSSTSRLYFFTFPRACPSISEDVGNCDGEASRGSETFGDNQDVSIAWTHKPDRINFAYSAANGSSLEGWLPGSGSDRLSITGGKMAEEPGRLCTPDLPGVKAGDGGGPINIDFNNEFRGAEVYFYGVVFHARSATEC